jgi:hypothetical protein
LERYAQGGGPKWRKGEEICMCSIEQERYNLSVDNVEDPGEETGEEDTEWPHSRKERDANGNAGESDAWRERKQTYLKISSQVLDDADQQLGLTSREGRVRGVRHDCLFLLTMCLMWLVFDGKNIFVDQRDLMW